MKKLLQPQNLPVHLCLHIETAGRQAPGGRVQVRSPSLLTDLLGPHFGCEELSFFCTFEKLQPPFPRASYSESMIGWLRMSNMYWMGRLCNFNPSSSINGYIESKSRTCVQSLER